MLAIFGSQEHHGSHLFVLRYLFSFYLGRVRPADEGMTAIDKTVCYSSQRRGHPHGAPRRDASIDEEEVEGKSG